MELYERDDLVESRADAEEGMIDSCTIARPGATRVFNPATGKYEGGPSQPYAGKCMIKSTQNGANGPEAGGVVMTVVNTRIHLPAGTDVKDGDIITITESVFAPALAGRKFRVSGFSPGTWDTAYRVPVEVHT